MIGPKSGQNIFQSGKLGPIFHKKSSGMCWNHFLKFYFQVKNVKNLPQTKTLQIVNT